MIILESVVHCALIRRVSYLQVKLTFRGTFRSTHDKGISGPKSLFAAGVSFRSKARPNVKIQPCKFN